MTGLIVVASVLVAAGVGGIALRRRDGNFRPVAGEPVGAGAGEEGPVGAEAVADPLLASLGFVAGTPVTLVQFSSAFCAPCRVTRVLCADVAATVPGVRHVEVDAESHLEAVRALNILRTPTVLLVDAAGRIRRRASGAPTRAQLLAAVAAVLAGPGDPS